MKLTGIWLDKEKAHIVTFSDSNDTFKTILSNVENYHPSGGFGLGFKGSPQDALAEDKYMEREKQQLKRYFNEIASEIKSSENIVIFGPAQTGEKFYKELCKSHVELKSKVKDIVKTDSMTKNEIRAWVKEFFNIKHGNGFTV